MNRDIPTETNSLQPVLFDATTPTDWRKEVPSVSQLTRRLRGHIEGAFPDTWVRGEVSNFRVPASGHAYFILKDATAQLQAVLFRPAMAKLKFRMEDGLEILLHGRLTVYEQRGNYQLVADTAEPAGLGALQLAFEQLKTKLQAEGLFAAERKKPLPYLPKRIAMITSPTGAAVRDMLTVLSRRAPQVSVSILPVAVQGEKAAGDMVAALERLAKWNEQLPQNEKFDLVIIGRGGGSLEDLWAFNEEKLARAVAAFPLPIVSAVGHEIDFVITDFVADRRAPTPSAAAEIAAPMRDHLEQGVLDFRARLARAFIRGIEQRRLHVVHLTGRMLSPRERLRRMRERCRELMTRASLAVARGVATKKQRWIALSGRLDVLSPLATLRRGYTITFDSEGRSITTVAQATAGMTLSTRVSDGTVESTVVAVKSELRN